MTTALKIITDAYREANITAIGDTPTADEQAEGLDRLNGFLSSLFGQEIGTKMIDWPAPPAQTSPVDARWPRYPYDDKLPSDVWPYPPANARILASIAAATTMYFPSSPSPGARMSLTNVGSGAFPLTLNGNGRLIDGAATFVVADMSVFSGTTEWFYRDDTANWEPLAPLDLGDESPLPDMYDDLLVIGTAARLVTRHGRSLTEESLAMYRRQLTLVRARYQQTQEWPAGNSRQFRSFETFSNRRSYW